MSTSNSSREDAEEAQALHADALPAALRPLFRRLESVPDLSEQDLLSVLFVVRLGDLLHRSFYATFLTQSLVQKLCKKLGIPGLLVEVEVFCMKWSFREGTVSVAHRILSDYDMYSVRVLSKIGRGVLDDILTPQEGLHLIAKYEDRSKLESCYRDFPGRQFVIPFMASTVSTVFFGGSWYDLGFSAVCGAVAGLVAWAGATYKQLWSIVDYAAATAAAMVAMAFITAFPESACFSAQILGTLYWFLYGTAFVMSIYEMTNNQLVTGVTRLALALVRSYGLAFGAMLGAWLAFYGGPNRLTAAEAQCNTKDHQIADLWLILLMPLAGIACLMQFRVRLRDFPLCLLVQIVAYLSQYLIANVWNQPDFLANLIPAYLITLVSHVITVTLHRLKVAGLKVSKEDYIEMVLSDDVSPRNVTVEKESLTANGDAQCSFNFDNNDAEHGGLNISEGWAKQGIGYLNEEGISYARSDSWYCILPALYLLVPGAKVLQSAISDLMKASLEESGGDFNTLAESVLMIGLSQVLGLRLGYATIWALTRVWKWMTCKPGKERHSANTTGSIHLSP